jgi:hypothetical protein
MRYLLACLVAVALVPDSYSKDNALTVEVCRESTDADILADCIEKKLDDPCLRSGGKMGDAQCAYGNSRVAERRIKRAIAALAA